MAVIVERQGEAIDVTFTYTLRPGDGPVALIAPFASGGASARLLSPTGDGTASRTWRLPSDVLCTYLFWVGREGCVLPDDPDELLAVFHSDAGAPVVDPDHDDRFAYPVDPERPGPPFVQSILRGPDAEPEPYLGAPLLGTLSEHRLSSEVLGDERRVWVHSSIGCDEAIEPPALMLVFDGGIYAHLLHTPEQVDALVAGGVLPPMVTLYCHYADEPSRHAELMCRTDFADFVMRELLPWAVTLQRFTADPARTVVAGSSLGGLSAGWLALRHPDRFGHVIAQSPSCWWHPNSPAEANWLAQEWAVHGSPSVRIYAEMGTFERQPGADGRSGYDHTVDFVEAARRRGSDATLEPYCGGHDYLAWRATFPRALRWIADGLRRAQ